MNPPLRSLKEVEDLKKLVGLGAVDVFATDHAPHLLEEKYQDVARSPSGVPAVELFYPLIFEIVRQTGLPVKQAIAMSTSIPAKIFGFEGKGSIANGNDADFVWLGEPFQVARRDIVSKCGWSPFEGMTLPHRVLLTIKSGLPVFKAEL
jgi:dihydroorotase